MRLVISTISEKNAHAVARRLVEERLVACVNIVPGVRSVYMWQDRIEEGGESLMLMKTTAEKVSPLTQRLIELHPYELPEIVAVPLNVEEGNLEYLDWVRQVVRGIS